MKNRRTRAAGAAAPKQAKRPSAADGGWRVSVCICVLLAAVTLACYGQVRHFDFVNYDDPDYVTRNGVVRAGLSLAGFKWALTSFDAANWFPLTWLTHMADCQVFGLDSGLHHLTNVGLHILAALLLFGALKRLTGAQWGSAWVAFVFALHPLHVESVAWVAERKDVLCALFWFAALWCYARYVEKPGTGRYLAVALAFVLGLMSKPMIVTLPLVLLLLDFWPLRRPFSVRLLMEKAPLLLLSGAASVLTILAQGRAGAVATLAGTPLAARMEGALVSYVVYIRDLFWPVNLAVLYPLPASVPPAGWIGAAMVLAGISYFASRLFRSRPYLMVGWCWYLITLIPVIGMVQVGSQSHADRYTYVPMIGLSIMIAWGAADLAAWRPRLGAALRVAGAAVCLACAAVTWSQTRYWQDTESLDRHALEVTAGNYILRHNLADYYLQHGRNEEARQMEAEAVSINPEYVEARLDLGLALSLLGRYAESEIEYRRGLALHPEGRELVVAHSGLGAALAAQHKIAQALPELQLAAALRPESAEGHFNLGSAYAETGRAADAAPEFAVAIRLDPGDAEARHKYAMVLSALGKSDEAAEQLSAVTELRPNDPAARYNLGIVLAQTGRIDQALDQFSQALRLKPDFDAANRAIQSLDSSRGRDGREAFTRAPLRK